MSEVKKELRSKQERHVDRRSTDCGVVPCTVVVTCRSEKAGFIDHHTIEEITEHDVSARRNRFSCSDADIEVISGNGFLLL